MNLPFISCLCPTFRRPKLLRNAIECFLSQDYPADRRELIIVDDDDAYENLEYKTPRGNYRVISHSRAYSSLTEKYNAIAGIAEGEVFAVWEDDDVYLPWHLSSNVECMGRSLNIPWLSKSKRVFSTYGNRFQVEESTGRFHASLVFNRVAFEKVGGWPNTKRADFDQMFIQSFIKNVSVCDPTERGAKPSYCFMWEQSNCYHGQSFMRSPDDEEWYSRGRSLIPVPDDYPRYLYPQATIESIKVLELATSWNGSTE